MKVFLAVPWHPTAQRPLWANWIVPHATALTKVGVEVCVLHVDLKNGADSNDSGCNVPGHFYSSVKLPSRRWTRTRFFYRRLLWHYQEAFEDLYRRAAAVYGIPDLLHAHVTLPTGFVAANVGSSEGIPVVVTEHYSGFEYDARFPWRLGPFVREMAPKIEAFWAVSEGFAERIERTGVVSVNGVRPNPIDTDYFVPAAERERHVEYRIVTTGGLNWIKGTDVLFEALKLISTRVDFSLTIYGSTARASDYKHWLYHPRLRGRIHTPGPVSQAELRDTFQRSDLYVTSSRSETACVSMLQALSSGIPIVTTRCGGPETLVDSSTGEMVPRNDPGALAAAITGMIANRDRYEPGALHTFVTQRYSLAATGCKLLKSYKEIVSRRHAPHAPLQDLP